jgi:DNA-binding HxlR family transcriptional regulator
MLRLAYLGDLAMYDRKIDKHYCCGLEITMEIIGGKWKPTLINLIHQGIMRPSDLQRAMPLASRRALNTQLNELQEHGIVEKTIYPVLPPHVEYRITAFGETLLPLTLSMETWGNAHRGRFSELLGLPKAAITP